MRLPRLAFLAGLGLVSCASPEPPKPVPVPPAALVPPPVEPPEAPAPEPAAEAAAGITLEQLLDVHRATAPRALGREKFLFLSDAPGTMQIFSASLDAAPTAEPTAPVQLTKFPDRVVALRLAPGGKGAVFLKDKGGDENFQIHWLDLAAGDKPEATQALSDAPKVRHTLPVFDDAGKRFTFTSNARNGKDMDLYVEALPAKKETFGKKPVVALSGSHAVADFLGDRVIVSEMRSGFDQDLWLIDAKNASKKLLTKHKGDERWVSPRFTRDGKSLLVLTDRGREFLSLVALDVATGKVTPVLELDHDVQDLDLPSYTSRKAEAGQPEDIVALTVNVDGVEEVHVVTLDAKRKVVSKKKTDLGGVVSSLDLAPAGDVAFVGLERPNLPTEVYRVDVATGAVTRATKSHHAGIDTSRLVPAELITMKASDGKTISFFYYQTPPNAGEKRPVVISVHGGPEGQAQPNFSPLVQWLALSGYAVAAPNVRGSTGYGKSFSHLDDKEKREDSVRDLSEVGKFIAARPDVDPARIALLGGSYGGYMVLAGLTLYPDQWAAGVDIVGIANFRTFLEQTAPYRRHLREAEYGSLAKDGAFLDRVSPIHKVDRIKAPLMVVHGTRDPRVPIGEARQIAEAVKKRGLPVELLTFEDEGHGIAKRKNRLVAFPAMVDFLDKHVKAKASP
ncbi:alpha/beta hydrolase family protein [Polyangium spumosum]|uniref:Prolyl oligopeptidase family serine peptidase n=1 Tax=Polyangium spumosum TaxID=889282 RepID=A0A6N7Q3I9_9BACT|nr:S9 family peptidase [Polyangium spumosum]MRG95471.1 prolyl oligopeptidase family serine peptidase [Polyangium spumosum]